MGGIIYGCSGLTSLDVSNFNTANVTNMSGMFAGCSGLTSLDLSNFNTANVKYMSGMFFDCPSLTTIYCNESWSCEDSGYMFYNCTSLKGAIAYDSEKTDATYANPENGYFSVIFSPYAALNEEGNTLTFYYDKDKNSRNGMSVGPFQNSNECSWYDYV